MEFILDLPELEFERAYIEQRNIYVLAFIVGGNVVASIEMDDIEGFPEAEKIMVEYFNLSGYEYSGNRAKINH